MFKTKNAIGEIRVSTSEPLTYLSNNFRTTTLQQLDRERLAQPLHRVPIDEAPRSVSRHDNDQTADHAAAAAAQLRLEELKQKKTAVRYCAASQSYKSHRFTYG